MKIKIQDRNIQVFQFVDRFELDCILIGEDDSLIFVIDIFKNTETGVFFPKVQRRELFSISPTNFIGKQSQGSDEEEFVCDEELIVGDTICAWESIMEDNPDDVLQKVLNEISDKFNGIK